MVTDRRRRPVIEHCRDAVAAGVDLIELREPGLDGRALAVLTETIVQLTRVRAIAPPGFLVGRSVRSAEDVLDVEAHVDYFIAGTVFPTSSKPGLREYLGPDGLAAIARVTRVPVLGIGGITIERLEAISGSGAAGVAAIGMFDGSGEELGFTVREARRRFDRVRSGS